MRNWFSAPLDLRLLERVSIIARAGELAGIPFQVHPHLMGAVII